MTDTPNILIDAYNLRLKQGSGIKTYGLSLLEAISRLGLSASLLTDRPVPRTRLRHLHEVLFADQLATPGKMRNAASMLMHAVRPFAPTPIQISSMVQHNGYLPAGVGMVHNLRHVYEHANWAFQRFQRLTTIRVKPRPALWHATTPLPIRVQGVPMITTIHDLIPLRLPYATLDDKQFFYRLVNAALRDSELVLTVSECTRNDILNLFDVDPAKVIVTWQALPTLDYTINDHFVKSLLAQHKLEPQKFLLFVGNIEPKKNISGLIHAASLLPEDMPLVIVGRKAWLWEEQLETATHFFGKHAPRRVRVLGYMPTEVVQTLYQNALCLVFPSMYEGFGLPPLEAMRQGCPVVTSNVSSLPEVCGDAALYFDPHEPNEIRHAVEQLLNDAALRARLVEAGYRRVEHFDAVHYANRLRDAYGRVVSLERRAAGPSSITTEMKPTRVGESNIAAHTPVVGQQPI